MLLIRSSMEVDLNEIDSELESDISMEVDLNEIDSELESDIEDELREDFVDQVRDEF